MSQPKIRKQFTAHVRNLRHGGKRKLLTAGTVKSVNVSSSLAEVDNGVNTGEGSATTALHAPEGIDTAQGIEHDHGGQESGSHFDELAQTRTWEVVD